MSNAFEVPGFRPGVLKAGADLSALQFRAVKLDANGDLIVTGAGEQAAGILQNKPVSGEACELEMDGISKATAKAAFGEGIELMAEAATGKLLTATSGNRVVAVSLTPAGADGDLVSVKVVGLSGALLA